MNDDAKAKTEAKPEDEEKVVLTEKPATSSKAKSSKKVEKKQSGTTASPERRSLEKEVNRGRMQHDRNA